MEEDLGDLLIIIQARMGSTRLPGKMLEFIGDEMLIEVVIRRLIAKIPIDRIFVATSTKARDKALSDQVKKFGVNVFEGSEMNVFSRFKSIVKKTRCNYICRLTGDSPLVDPQLILDGLAQIKERKVDYVSTTLGSDFPIGIHVEIFRKEVICNVKEESLTASSIEHVTPFIYNDKKYSSESIVSNVKYPNGRYTVDYKADIDFLRKLVSVGKIRLSKIDTNVLMSISKECKDIFNINSDIEKSRTELI